VKSNGSIFAVEKKNSIRLIVCKRIEVSKKQRKDRIIMSTEEKQKQEPEEQNAKTRLPRAPRFKVSITEELIAEAVKINSGHCMIADAIKVAMPKAKNISVDIQTIRFTDSERGLRYTYLTPLVAQRLILTFDDGLMPAAFTFHLRETDAWVALANLRTDQRVKVNKKRNGDPAFRSEVRAKMKKSQLVADDDHAPRRIGGKPLPKLPELSQRREFGMRIYRGNRESRQALAAQFAQTGEAKKQPPELIDNKPSTAEVVVQTKE
jgi:hypothetical protein